jgi:hypothetical protein
MMSSPGRIVPRDPTAAPAHSYRPLRVARE